MQQATHILAHVADGIVVVDFDLRIRWANATFLQWCGGQAVGRGFYEALGAPQSDGEFCPFHSVLASASDSDDSPPVCVTTHLTWRGNRHLEVRITQFQAATASPLFVALCHDTTSVVLKQQKLDALGRAGRELAALDPVQMAELSVPERVDLLRGNIRHLTRDLLHYEVIEIRLLDAESGRLDPLLQEGMIPDAASRVLFARPDGNGVTGFVAATGISHLCPDTLADPLFLPGSSGARSSLTVPLRFADQVVGTFNVESPRPGAFGEEDLQFAEIFSHAVAAALHTLDLLRAEKTSSASQSIDAVNREIALPVDNILADAGNLLERYLGHDPEVAQRVRDILANARQIKQSIVRVGEDLAPQPLPSTIRLPPPPALRGLRVLVVDNDDAVRRSAHQFIGRWGGIVETARDGKEAVTMARFSPYDAVLADIRLPDMAGYEIYRAIREAQPTARVILMTGFGYDPGHSLVKARQDGLRHVLYKPFRVDQLRDALSNLRKDPA